MRCCAVLYAVTPQAVFEEMDLDHDGVITGQQLHEALAKMGASISSQDVAEFLKVSKVSVGFGGCAGDQP